MYDGKDIQQHNADRRLHILKGFKETEDFFEKGHMDFGGSPKGNLQKKQITDKQGHQTSRWVKNGDDEKKAEFQTGQMEDGAEDFNSKSDANSNPNTAGMKTSEEHASETSSDDLKKYIANNPDGEHVAAAQAELSNRGEEVDTNSAGSADMDSDGDGQAGEQETGQVDYNDPEVAAQALADPAVAQAVISIMTTDPHLTLASALRLNAGGGGNNTEAHGALDAAQQAIDAAKSATGHPDAAGAGNTDEENGNAVMSDDVDSVLESIGEAVFNSQGKMDLPRIESMIGQLIEAGVTMPEITQAIGEMSWAHPDTPEDEETKADYKAQWDDVVAKLNLDDSEFSGSENEEGDNKSGFGADNDKSNPNGSDEEGEGKEESVDKGENTMAENGEGGSTEKKDEDTDDKKKKKPRYEGDGYDGNRNI